jgi:hypothetical protein
MITLDTETVGLTGPIVLLQYAYNDDPVTLHSPWICPISDTLVIIESICKETVVGFNLAFDWFHLCQLYTTLTLLAGRVGYDAIPIDHIDLYASLEPDARDGPCLKPVSACDLMLHARKGPYQSTMDRKDIRIKRVPSILAQPLAAELEKRIKLKDIYFARRKDKKAPKWTIEQNGDFADLILKFKPSSALKTLATDALGLDPENVLLYKYVEVDPRFRPMELGYAPFALAVSNASRNWEATFTKGKNRRSGYAWPGVIQMHITHWNYNATAREYAEKDVTLTRDLYHHFGSPEPGDDDSLLACMVGAVRWKGFKINEAGIRDLRAKAIAKSEAAPKAPSKVRAYLMPHLSATERLVLITDGKESTKRVILEEISRWPDHPAAVAATACLEARKATKEIELYDKLLQAGRFHASFKVIGTLSTRMSGSDGLNPQGIKHDKYVRKQFPLAFGPLELRGGDFAGFEVSIAAAVYGDAELQKQLCTCAVCGYVCTLEEYSDSDDCTQCSSKDSRKKIHGLFAEALHPELSYDQILATKGTATDLYNDGKRGVFAEFYGGNASTLVNRGIAETEEQAKEAEERFMSRFKGAGRFRERIYEAYCSMRQNGGIGSKVEWNEPKDYIETVLGFRRYFTLENSICKALFNLANKPPPSWKGLKIKCVRRDREQMVGGALMSALYAAAFNIQSKNLRAAANHVIQSTGASITKKLQTRIWGLQPSGVGDWIVQPMNIHDEIMVPSLPAVKESINEIVRSLVTEMRPIVPLIKIDWSEKMETWAEK